MAPSRTLDTSGGIRFRPVVDADLGIIRMLNNDAFPAVPRATSDEVGDLVKLASWGIVADIDGEVAGFVLCLEPGLDYASENYRYFEEHFDNHFYIDRIVVGKSHRGTGLGVSLYQRVFAEAKARGASEVTCEVNLDPPNPVSIAFHHRMGFRDVGTQDTKGGSVHVQLMAASVGSVS